MCSVYTGEIIEGEEEREQPMPKYIPLLKCVMSNLVKICPNKPNWVIDILIHDHKTGWQCC